MTRLLQVRRTLELEAWRMPSNDPPMTCASYSPVSQIDLNGNTQGVLCSVARVEATAIQ